MKKSDTRYISRLTKDTLAIVLAGGRGSRLHELTSLRSKPAVHFGGKFRIIDFPLSNCINSGIRKIGVVTQYKAHSLIRHLVRGWGHFKNELGEFIEILPASQQISNDWYQGTADSLYQNLGFIQTLAPKYIMILAGDQVYQMDYGDMLAEHVQSGADLSVACIEVPVEQAAGAFGVMTVNEDGRITAFEEKPPHPKELTDKPGYTLASMGNYIFNTEFLIEQLLADAEKQDSCHDFGANIIPSSIADFNVHGFRFRDRKDDGQDKMPYWRDVGTLDSFWEANMDLVAPDPELNIYDRSWPIWTYQEQLPPAKFVFNNEERRGQAVDSMVSGGCIVSGGKVSHSVLFSNVRVNSYSEVNSSVLLPNVVVGRHARIQNAIIDSASIIPEHMEIGFDAEYDKARGFRITDKGTVLVTQQMLTKYKEKLASSL
ncbi:glucose-1-phosphate adenylyltransferase [Paraneptunicella aestuarii]|uniref:glucose-1-phosphate adenylyltransferase n=1 Tax=Paraneptunicella aestuarii TaxID=2831148 RepID=UPI001E2AAA98|nr:glucose-1-phosphate adenylyltransferase [Paraneptunicella aestuarii]UAA37820.1 glucose-1-phosphate adenylyltransferase [Paraneptunicella aestuarii]